LAYLFEKGGGKGFYAEVRGDTKDREKRGKSRFLATLGMTVA